ncbi:hypothetical protein PENTCL1PPCAC_19259, partial [Pristionchus entomophagus]
TGDPTALEEYTFRRYTDAWCLDPLRIVGRSAVGLGMHHAILERRLLSLLKEVSPRMLDRAGDCTEIPLLGGFSINRNDIQPIQEVIRHL